MCIPQLVFFSFILFAYKGNGELTDMKAYSPRVADTTIFEGDGGSYHSWSSSNFALLGESKVGAGILLLHPHGFALPHYADSNKIGYVLQELTDMKAYSPRVADTTIFEGDGGSYHSWSSSNFALLGESKVGAGILLLHPHGFALPHYADSNKIGYVLQGSCTVGTVSPGASEEKVVIIKQGDAIPVPAGQVSWWFNAGDSDTNIVFIGETSISQIPGEFTYFFLAGTVGVLRGFSTEFISKAYNLNQNDAITLVTNQTGSVGIKLGEGIRIPQQRNDTEYYAEFASSSTTAVEFSSVEQVGLSFKHARLDGNAVFQPIYATNSVQVAYVIKGSGRVQFAGANGERLLDATVKAGELFVVPPFVVAMEIADAEGMEYLSVIKSSKPVIWEFSSETSIWNAFSPAILQASLSISPEFAYIFLAKMTSSIVPMCPIED